MLRQWINEGCKAWAAHWPAFTIGALLLFAFQVGILLPIPGRWLVPISFPLLRLGALEVTLHFPSNVFSFLAWALSCTIGVLLEIGYLLLGLGAVLEKRSSPALLFRPFYYRPFLTLWAEWLRWIYTLFGLILFIIPGINASLKYFFAPLFVQTSRTSFQSTLERNRIAVTYPHRLRLLGLLFLCTLLSAALSILVASLEPFIARVAYAIGAVVTYVVIRSWTCAALAASFKGIINTAHPSIAREVELPSRYYSMKRLDTILSVSSITAVALVLAFICFRPVPSDLVQMTFPTPLPPSHGASVRLGMAAIHEFASVPNTDYIALLTDHGLEIRDIESKLLGHVPVSFSSRFGPTSGVNLSPDKKLAVVWNSWEQTAPIKMLDLEGGQVLWSKEGKPTAVAFSPDGAEVAMIVEDKVQDNGRAEIKILDPLSGELIDAFAISLPYHSDLVSIEYSPCGKLLLINGCDYQFRFCSFNIVNRATGEFLFDHLWPGAATFTPWGTVLVANHERLEALDPWSEKALWQAESPSRAKFCFRISQQVRVTDGGEYAAVIPECPEAHIWDLKDQTRTGIIDIRECMEASTVLRLRLGSFPIVIPWVKMNYSGCRISSPAKINLIGGDILVVQPIRSTLHFWSLSRHKLLARWYLPDYFEPFRSLTWSPDSRHLLFQRAVYKHTEDQWEPIGVFPDEVESVAFSHDGRLVAVNTGWNVQIWQVKNWQLLSVLETRDIRQMVFSPDNQRLLILDKAGTVQSLESFSRHPEILLSLGGINPWAARFSPKGSLLFAQKEEVSGLWGRLLKLPSGQLISELSLPHELIWAEFSPDETRLALLFRDGAVEIRELPSCSVAWRREGKGLAWWEWEGKGLPTLAFSPDGKRLAVSEADRIVILNAHTGTEMISFDEALSAKTLAFSPDGALLAAGLEAGDALVWDLRSLLPGDYERPSPRAAFRAGSAFPLTKASSRP